MALPHKGAFIARSSSALLRFATPVSPLNRCPQCLRNSPAPMWYRPSTRRQIQTATAYQPTSLFQEPPPRNTGVPQTSIAGSASEAKKAVGSSEQSQSPERISEEEAQKTQTPALSKPLRPRRYNFGPRKATIKLSQSAVAHLRELLQLPEPKLIRIGTRAKGCSGLAYHLEYVDKPSTLDEQVEQDGVKVLIDNKALLNIIGSEMDWLEDKLNERFIFKNPNITEQCGCGESFSVS